MYVFYADLLVQRMFLMKMHEHNDDDDVIKQVTRVGGQSRASKALRDIIICFGSHFCLSLGSGTRV